MKKKQSDIFIGIICVCLIVLTVFAVYNYENTGADSTPETPGFIIHESNEKLSNVYKAYHELLSEAVNEFGFGSRDVDINGNTTLFKGVIYAELIDFNDDRMPELLYIIGRESSFLDVDCFIYGYSEDSIILHGNYTYLSLGLHTSIRIIESRTGTKYLYIGRGMAEHWVETYYSLNNNQWMEVLNRSYMAHHEGWNWFINDINVNKHEYENALEVYFEFIESRRIDKFEDNYETVNNVLKILEEG